MWLSLTNDDGEVSERWYISEKDISEREVVATISDRLPVYDSKEEAEADEL